MPNQSRYTLDDFSNQKTMKPYPIKTLVKNLIKIAHNINKESVRNNSRVLKMLHNCFATFEILIAIRHNSNEVNGNATMHKAESMKP